MIQGLNMIVLIRVWRHVPVSASLLVVGGDQFDYGSFSFSW